MTNIIPSKIVAGDTLNFCRSLSDYPAADGYQISYKLVNAADVVEFSGADQAGGEWLFDIKPATTKDWQTGKFTWYEIATKGADRFTLANGQTEIKPDPTAAHDTRSYAQKMLDAIEAMLEKKATKDQQNYAINGRSLTRYSIEDLIALRDKFRAEVTQEKQRQDLENGLGTNKIIRTRF